MSLLIQQHMGIDLQEFGLSENEGKTYLTLLEYGALTVYELADKTGLNRSYLYDLLNRMAEKGYISTITQKKTTAHQAIAPRQLHELFLLRAAEFARMIPTLETMPRVKEDTTTELYKGKDVFRSLLKDMLATASQKGSILIISADENEFEKIEPIIIQQYFRKLKEKKIRERVLIKKGDVKFKTGITTYRELDQDLIGNTSIFVYEDKVAEIVLGNPHYMTITKNVEMAKTKKKLFEFLWKEGANIRKK